MEAIYKQNANGQRTMLREGPAIIERLDLAMGDVTADAWTRLMPSGNGASKSSATELDLSDLRDSLVPQDFSGWKIKILNAGYVQGVFTVASCTAAGICALAEPIRLAGTPDDNLEWVMYPEMLDDCAIMLEQGSTATAVDIGHTPEEKHSPANTEIRQIFALQKETDVDAPFYYKGSDLDKLFYRFDAAAANTIVWGNFSVGR